MHIVGLKVKSPTMFLQPILSKSDLKQCSVSSHYCNCEEAKEREYQIPSRQFKLGHLSSPEDTSEASISVTKS